MENEQIKKKKGCYYKLITQFNLSGKWQYNEIPRYTIILINLMMDYVLHNLIYTSIWSGSSKIPLISGAQWYLIYLNFSILVKTGSIYDLFLKNLNFFSSPISILYTKLPVYVYVNSRFNDNIPET